MESDVLRRVSSLRRDVTTLPLASHVRHSLVDAGYATLADLVGATPATVARQAGITQDEALEALQHGGSTSTGLRSPVWRSGKTADVIFQQERRRRRVVTFCPALDQLLGGGVAPCEITEFCGVPGIGKTQLGMQLAVDVQIPKEFGGLGGQAVYIDTEGSFMAERVEEIAHACLEHLQKIATSAQDADLLRLMGKWDVEKMLANIHFFRVHDSTEQIALVHVLPEFLRLHPEVRLVVLDSVAFHFRQEFRDMAKRTRLLAAMMQALMNVANDRHVAVVLTNQVTTKIHGQGDARLVPALGDSFAHASTNRVLLFWHECKRHAHLYKSPYLPGRTVAYALTSQGVRGVDASS